MPLNYEEFRKTISREIIAIEKRVNLFVNHRPSTGNYREFVLMQTLRNYLPESVRVGTGFVVSDDQTTNQIDVIIYSSSIAPFFQSGDFVIVEKESVKAIIEVKTSLVGNQFDECYKKAHENGEIIGKPIFNGIFCYQPLAQTRIDELSSQSGGRLGELLTEFNGQVNHISLGPNVFAKYWSQNTMTENQNGIENANISWYNIKELSFGYFISNLCEFIGGITSEERQNYYYPIGGNGKEDFRITRIDL